MTTNKSTQSYDYTSAGTKGPDTFSYKGWMNSDNFLKRAFGVFGYQMLAGCIVQIVFMLIFLVFAAIFGGIGAILSN